MICAWLRAASSRGGRAGRMPDDEGLAMSMTSLAPSPRSLLRDPVPLPRTAGAGSPGDSPGGALAVEVAALLGDTIVGVRHCVAPAGGRSTAVSWGLVIAGALGLAAAAGAFGLSLQRAADNQARFAAWTRDAHRPAYAFRPVRLGVAVDSIAFGGVALGIAGLALGLARLAGARRTLSYRIGAAPGVELAVAGAPAAAFPLVARSGDGFVFNHAAGIDGELIAGGTTTPLSELAAAGRSRPSQSIAGAIEVAIPRDARIRARVGHATFVVSAIEPPGESRRLRRVVLDRRLAACVAGSLAVHVALCAVSRLGSPDAVTANVGFETLEEIRVRARITADEERPAASARPDRDGTDGGDASRAPGMRLPAATPGRPDAPADSQSQAPRVRGSRPRPSRDEAIQQALSDGILGSDALRGRIATASASDYAGGFDRGLVSGAPAGTDSVDSFGGGRRGVGGGGGDPEDGGTCMCDSGVVVGAYTTTGTGAHAGDGYRGPPDRGLRSPGHPPVVPRIDEPRITGSYDKSLIRRYIHRQHDKIAYCYDRQLLAHALIEGEIRVSFFISPSGAVQGVSGAGFDRGVAGCVAGVIGAIAFPAPGDGGVQVTYPFHFHIPGA